MNNKQFIQRVRSNLPENEDLIFGTHFNSVGTPTSTVEINNRLLVDNGGVIVDYIKSGSGHPWAFKPCLHQTWSYECLIPPGPRQLYHINPCVHNWWHNAGNYVMNWDKYRFAGFLSSVAENNTWNGVLPPLVDFDKYALNIKGLIESMTDLTDSPTDLLVFLYEIQDIARSAKFILSRWRVLKKLIDASKSAVKNLGNVKLAVNSLSATLKLVADESSDSLLQYAFGLRPLISDVSNLVERMTRFWDNHETLKKGANKLHRTSRRFVDGSFDPDLNTERPVAAQCPNGDCYIAGPGSAYYTIYGWTNPSVSATILYRYALPDNWDAISGKLGYALSSLGIQPGLSTIWNVIPFSFVVDWIFDIDAMLSPFHWDPSWIKVNILDMCASVKHGYTVELRERNCPTELRDIPVFRVTRSFYERRVGNDLLNVIPPLTLPNNFQLLLGAALLWVRGA
jgi:hypothetical protein